MSPALDRDPALAGRSSRWFRRVAVTLAVLLVLAVVAAVGVHVWLQRAMVASLPRVDGTLQMRGLSAPVRVARNGHGIPHIIAANVDDAVMAQGFVTAQDRLWQMDMLRRHVTGRLAEVLGAGQLKHDRTQRLLQLKQTAERNFPGLPEEDRRYFQRYADGVNAAMELQRPHLPAEFKVLGYEPEKWTAVDSLLVGYAMVEDLSTVYPGKLDREAVEARLPADMQGDLFPVGSGRDHPPTQGGAASEKPRVKAELPEDETQASLRSPEHVRGLMDERAVLKDWVGGLQCVECRSGSNNWAVSGTHTKSGKPIVSNDPHLSVTVPGIWYTTELEAGDFHVTGASVPGIPFVVVGHNAHVAWGFTNSYGDVQDLYVEQVEGDKFRGADGEWHPLTKVHETIHVKRGADVSLDVLETKHGETLTPILTPLFAGEKRSLAMRWSVYDLEASGVPLYRVNAAADGKSLVEAFRNYGSPAQNLVWGDDAGHIGYHLVGKIPMRGENGESGLSPVPVHTGSYEWTGYLPYDKLPAVTDPESGIVATANARITPDGYPYGITLDWAAPYRNERIWKLLDGRTGMTADDSLAVQNDVYSALDKVYAERIVVAVERVKRPSKRAQEASAILRGWDGKIETTSAAANLAAATRRALDPMVLKPRLQDAWDLYSWGDESYVLERMVETSPDKWLPAEYANWDELLVAALERGMKEAGAPADLKSWQWGGNHTLQLGHPVFGSTWLVARLSGAQGTAASPMPGSGLTVRASNGKHSASLRFTTDLGDVAHAMLTLPMGESGNALSGSFMDQWSAWYAGRAVTLPWGDSATATSASKDVQKTLVLTP